MCIDLMCRNASSLGKIDFELTDFWIVKIYEHCTLNELKLVAKQNKHFRRGLDELFKREYLRMCPNGSQTKPDNITWYEVLRNHENCIEQSIRSVLQDAKIKQSSQRRAQIIDKETTGDKRTNIVPCQADKLSFSMTENQKQKKTK